MLNHKLVRIPRVVGNTSLNSSPFMHKEVRLPKLAKGSSRTPHLDLNLTQNLELPALSRFHTPVPKRPLQSFKHFAANRSISSERQHVNLEKIIQQEQKLSELLEFLGKDPDYKAKVVEYWEISSEESLWSLERLFKDARIKKSLQNSLIIEAVAVFFLIQLVEMMVISSVILKQLRNMLTQLHQNFLTVIDLVLMRLPNEVSGSPWVVELKDCVQSKKIRPTKRLEHSTALNHNTESIQSSIKTIAHMLPLSASNIVSLILTMISNIDKYSIQAARIYLMPNTVVSIKNPHALPEATKEFTLVMDLDETLVHYSGRNNSGELLIRPYCEWFLQEMSEIFDIVIFTAGIQDYADWAIDLIDPEKHTKHRLYRQHTVYNGCSYIKDIGKLGRNLQKMIIVDNVPGNYHMQQENGIPIKTWVGDSGDTELKELANVLKGKKY